MTRLEPRAPVVKGLFYANNGYCAFPECPIETVTVRSDSRQPTVNVEMAHIYAAEEGGPRSEEGLDDEFLRSFENLLLLCPNHHRNAVDKDWPNEYDVSRLVDMKEASEKDSSELEVGPVQVHEALTKYRNYYQSIEQQQAGSIVNAQDVRQGLSGGELIQLLETTTQLTIDTYRAGAESKAGERVLSFNAAVESSFHDPRLQPAIEDPGFHRSTRRAQEAAACADDEAQIDVLVSLLAERAEPDTDSTAKIAIDRAYAVVSECSPTSTDMLTAVLLTTVLYNRSTDMSEALNGLEPVFVPFVSNVPSDRKWFEELKMLDALRLAGGTRLKPISQLWGERMLGLVTGPFEVENLPPPIDELPNEVKNQLFMTRDGQFELAISGERDIRQLLDEAGEEISELIDPVVAAIKSNRSTDRASALAKALDENETFAVLQALYNPLPSLEVTPIGKAVAYANLKRKGIQPLSLGIGRLSDLL